METPRFPTIASIARTDLVIADPQSSVRQAADLMRDRNVTSVVFVADGTPYVISIEHVLGVVHSGHDLSGSLTQFHIPPAAMAVQDTNVLNAMEQMEEAGTRYLLVADRQGNPTGIVTHTDMLNAIDPMFLTERKTVGEVVQRREFMTFTPDWILQDVLCHLVNIEDSIIVVDEKELLGIITSKDAFRIVLSGRSTDGSLAEYMSSPVVTVPCTASIQDSLGALRNNLIKRAVVLDDRQQLLGVITQSELVSYAFGYWSRLLKGHSQDLRELVAQLAERAERYRADSQTDVLTGLGNRRRLNVRLRGEIERLRRYGGETFSFILIDIDNFREINERLGHAYGDEVIASIGGLIRRLLRSTDEAFRWGGDEFAVLAPHTPAARALLLARRICANAPMALANSSALVAISVGVAEYVVFEDTQNMFDRVGQALYRAKQNGRNRIEVATPLSIPPSS